MTTHRSRARCAFGLATLLAFAACGENIVQPSAGSTCDAGELHSGEPVVGALSSASCIVPYHFYTTNAGPYETYRVSLEAGKGYWLYLQQVPDAEGRNTLDGVLTLWGRDGNGASIPLAVSDDEALGISGRDAEFYFVAPESGTFSLVASGYDASSVGGYRLRMEECPVVAVADTVGVYELAFVASECLRHNMAGTAQPSRVVLVAVPAGRAEIVDVTVTSGAFYPFVELGGIGFDVFSNVYVDTDFSASVDEPAAVTISAGDVAGTLTLAVGAADFDPSGPFELELSRTAPVAPVIARRGEGRMALRDSFRSAAKR